MNHSLSTAARSFLVAVAERRTKDCEREFEKLRNGVENSEWNKGYLKALEGLLHTVKSSDNQYLYFNRIQMSEKRVRGLKEEFSRQSRDELYDDYDRGYFAALTDYASILEESKPWTRQVSPQSVEADADVNSDIE
ncbi:MAG: hypothetical protein QXK72_07580 [Candidatus Bathyarchaeia archaeon]